MGVQEENADPPGQRTEEGHARSSESRGRGPEYGTFSTVDQWESMFRELNEAAAGMYLTQDNVFKLINEKLARMFGRDTGALIDKAELEDLAFHENRGLVEKNLQKPSRICSQRHDGAISLPEFRAIPANTAIT
jgi:hypothetical protein